MNNRIVLVHGYSFVFPWSCGGDHMQENRIFRLLSLITLTTRALSLQPYHQTDNTRQQSSRSRIKS